MSIVGQKIYKDYLVRWEEGQKRFKNRSEKWTAANFRNWMIVHKKEITFSQGYFSRINTMSKQVRDGQDNKENNPTNRDRFKKFTVWLDDFEEDLKNGVLDGLAFKKKLEENEPQESESEKIQKIEPKQSSKNSTKRTFINRGVHSIVNFVDEEFERNKDKDNIRIEAYGYKLKTFYDVLESLFNDGYLPKIELEVVIVHPDSEGIEQKWRDENPKSEMSEEIKAKIIATQRAKQESVIRHWNTFKTRLESKEECERTKSQQGSKVSIRTLQERPTQYVIIIESNSFHSSYGNLKGTNTNYTLQSADSPKIVGFLNHTKKLLTKAENAEQKQENHISVNENS